MVEMESTLVCPGRSFRDALSYLETGVIGVLTRQCLLRKVPSLDPQLSTAGVLSEKSQQLWVPADCAAVGACWLCSCGCLLAVLPETDAYLIFLKQR